MPISSPSLGMSSHYEALFHAAQVDLHIPEIFSIPSTSTSTSVHQDGDGDGQEQEQGKEEWWERVERAESRSTAYFDEKLSYFVSMFLPDSVLSTIPGSYTPTLDAKEPTTEILRFLARLQLTMTASFIPPLPFLDSHSEPHKRSSHPIDPSLAPPTSSTLAPPTSATIGNSKHLPPTPRIPTTPFSATGSGNPPVTPNPFPATGAGEERYANVQGVTIWEGDVLDQSAPLPAERTSGYGGGGGRKVFKRDDGWQVVWKGQVPIAYVRTPIQNPLLALTASVTLRDHQHNKTHRKLALSADNASIRSGTTIKTDGTYEQGDLEEEDEDGVDDDVAMMQEIDLLGGLAGGEDPMPASRLAPSLRQDLSIPSGALPSALPSSAITPFSAPSIITPSSTSSGPSRERGHLPSLSLSHIPLSNTLRKSYRRVLSLSPGLRVRMRTLFLPQLLDLNVADDDGEGEGERRVVLCVEIENSVESSLTSGFEVENVLVEVGGKGGKATTELVCQQKQQSQSQSPSSFPFPLKLGSMEQYNLLYAVSIASTSSSSADQSKDSEVEEAVRKSLGRGDDQRPVSITLVGKPYRQPTPTTSSNDEKQEEYTYPTNTFNSRWNCSLDLAPFYSSLEHSHPHQNRSSQLHSQSRQSMGNRGSVSNANAIVGDKRYSLAGLLSSEKNRLPGQGQGQGQRPRPLLPSQAMNAPPGSRVTSLRPRDDHSTSSVANNEYGLLILVKLVSQSEVGLEGKGIKPLEPFSIEVFVHNQTDQIKRFRLNVPNREAQSQSQTQTQTQNMRRRRKDEPNWGLDDSVLKQLLINHETTSPSLIVLENDIRCGPLIPGASLSARVKFMALRNGVYKIDKLRLLGDDLDYTINPVLDVVVGTS